MELEIDGRYPVVRNVQRHRRRSFYSQVGERSLLQQRLHKTVVFVTHDLREALRLGSRIALMEAGRLVTVLSPREFLRSTDQLAAAYVRAFGDGLESAANLA